MENEQKQQAIASEEHTGTEAVNGQQGAAIATAKEETLIEWDGLLFGVRKSIRYHSQRAGLFEFMVKSTTALAVLASTGAIAALLKQQETIAIAVGALVAVSSTISLVFGWSQREHLHTDIKKRFAELEKAMVKCENPDGRTLAEMTADRLSIETYEPKPVDTLNIICHNDLCIAQGYGTIYKVGWLRHKFRHLDLPFQNPEVGREIGMTS
jgi:hypothetical protein